MNTAFRDKMFHILDVACSHAIETGDASYIPVSGLREQAAKSGISDAEFDDALEILCNFYLQQDVAPDYVDVPYSTLYRYATKNLPAFGETAEQVKAEVRSGRTNGEDIAATLGAQHILILTVLKTLEQRGQLSLGDFGMGQNDVQVLRVSAQLKRDIEDSEMLQY